jgi:dienelactone hydrolase
VFTSGELQIHRAQCIHNGIFSGRPYGAFVRLLLAVIAALVMAPVAAGVLAPPGRPTATVVRLIHYRAHDGVERPAYLLVPSSYNGGPIPLVISPHGRGLSAADNELLWGDLPGEGGFAVINPAGEGRRLHSYSWGYPGQIADLARMPAIVRADGVNVDPKRIYAFGGSMGGQEVLLLLARYPHLLAGAAAFDPATDMARRYRDFAALPGGATLQQLAREEVGGTPQQVPEAYALRSPDHYVRQIARSHVPLQLFWSTRDRIIRDQGVETAALAAALERDGGAESLEVFAGEWNHSAEMQPGRRLPRALARFKLLPWQDAPPVRD